MDEFQKKHFLAGFDLAACRKDDGKLHSYLGESTIEDFPDEIEMFGNTYTLENVIKGENGYESAQYV